MWLPRRTLGEMLEKHASEAVRRQIGDRLAAVDAERAGAGR